MMKDDNTLSIYFNLLYFQSFSFKKLMYELELRNISLNSHCVYGLMISKKVLMEIYHNINHFKKPTR